MVLREAELVGGEACGGVGGAEGSEGIDGVKVSTVAVGADGVAAQGGDADERVPKVAACGAAGPEAKGPVELEDICAERFTQGDVHGKGRQGEGGIGVVPGTVGAARNREGGPGGFRERQ